MRSGLLLSVSLFVLPAAAGWALHDVLRPHDRPDGLAALSKEVASPRHDPPKNRPLPRTPEEFEIWTKEHGSEMVPEGMGYRMPLDFSGWTSAQLQAALEDGLRDPGIAQYGGDTLHTAIVLLQEWTRRDPDGALIWLQNISSETTLKRLSSGICLGWPPERAEELMGFVGAHKDLFQGDYGHTYGIVLDHACESAALKGPQALAKLLKEGKDHDLQAPYGDIHFPPDFDFRAMAVLDGDLRKARNPEVSGYLINAWMKQSPEAAFEGLVSLSKDGQADLVSSVLRALYQPGERDSAMMEDRARRIAAKSGDIDPEQRQEMNAKVAKMLADQPERLVQFCQGYSDPQMKAEAGVQAATQLLPGSPVQAINLLDSVGGSSGEKIDRLNEILSSSPPQPPGRSVLLGPDKRAKIVDRLTSWGMSGDEACCNDRTFRDPMNSPNFSLRLATVLAGLAVGFFAAGAWSRNGQGKEQISGTAPTGSSSQAGLRHPQSHGGKGGAGTSFASLKALLSEDGGVVEARPAIERMTSDELRGLLAVAAFPMWGPPRSGEVQLRDGAVMAAAEELYRREGSAAMNWADASGHKEAAFALLRAFAAQDPIGANDHLKSYPFGHWDPNLLTYLVTQLGEGAMKHDAAEVLQLVGQWQTSSLFKDSFEVAPDFDFREYFSETADDWRGGPGLMLTSWAASNPEASGAYLREKLAASRIDPLVSPKAAFAGRAAMAGEEEAAKWFCDLLPEGREKDAGWALADLGGFDCTTSRANAILQNLQSDEGKARFTASLIQTGSFRPEANSVAISAIKQLGSESLQADAFIGCVKEYVPPGPARDRYASILEGMMNQVELPEVQRDRVREVLGK